MKNQRKEWARVRKLLKSIAKFLKICLAGIVALAVLTGFCLMCFCTGVRVPNESDATDFRWPANQWRSNMLEGFSWFKMDENGFNNIDTEHDTAPDVLFMGSSHMEATYISQSEHLAQLVQNSTSLDVYNIGTSGHTLYSNAKNIDEAVREYDPQQYVVIETSTVDMSIDDMKSVIDETYADIESSDNSVLYLLQKYVPPLKTIYKNIGDWIDADKAVATTTQAPDETDDSYSQVLTDFLKKSAQPVKDNGAQLIIFNHPRVLIDENGNFYTDADDEKTKLFAQSAKDAGVIFIDMTDYFKALYENEHKLPRGFVNTAVGGSHLNADGHQLIAQAITEVIMEGKLYGTE